MASRAPASATQSSHPTQLTYVRVAVVLTIVTVFEVATYYLQHVLGPVMIPLLLTLAAIKFVLVVGFYMHLKFDPPLLRGVFGWGLFVAMAIIVTMIALYKL
ncbi:cytochrome C oxidase subunit IV family protein [Thermorudis peleae]|uniref:cytochrome C oxidase subunit IV family protein n=1 Tax=Thermorudis peleae TaxID=1382356 RepID=UPI00056EB78F|nr:cytochrome C oxidase subunit IV family protein [Thermorudis peleae]MBX6753525.1 cytochrome C oxidase subunit IV family protein [Thermorudis peleae]